MITDFHAKYFAYEITKRCSSGSVERLAAVLADAQVDLNPHQFPWRAQRHPRPVKMRDDVRVVR